MSSDGGSGETRVDAVGDGAAINIRCSNGSKFTVKTSLDLTVGAFKAVLAQNCDVPADQQRLIYKGRILKDNDTLESYGLQSEHTIHMVRGSAPPAAAPSPAATAATNNPLPGITRGVGSNDSGLGGLGSSLFPGVGANALGGGGNAGLFGAGLPGFEQVQQQLTQNPNMMRELMNTPAIQSLMNNPELMRGLIMSNPQMREIMDRNPELAHVLNDPGILRQTLEVARNPELMREMMRNTDRAMSNIEATPEGFNMLRRMYENVQEPFLNATATGANNRNELGSNPFAALLGGQGNAQARNGSNITSNTGSEATAGGVAPNTNPLPNPWGSAGGTQTNTAPRTNPTGDVRPPSTGVLGGASGLAQLDQLFASMPDSTSMNQMQNQAVSNMMQSLLSNPQYMNQILSLNPQLRSMVELNPQLREMLQNPEFVRQLTSPEMMQQMMTMQQSLLSHLTTQQPNQEQGQTGAAPGGGASGPGLDMLLNMFGGLGMGGSLSAPTTPDVGAPEEVYATQLSQLQEMGFFDAQENIRALRATSGNVHAAVERLLGGGNLGQ